MAAHFDYGASLHITSQWKDSSGTLVDPTTVTVYLMSPDGTITNFPGVKDSTGNYHYDFLPPSSGEWLYRWEATGPGAGAVDDTFVVDSTPFHVGV